MFLEQVWFVLFVVSLLVNLYLYNRYIVVAKNFQSTMDTVKNMGEYLGQISQSVKVISDRNTDTREKVEEALKALEEIEPKK